MRIGSGVAKRPAAEKTADNFSRLIFYLSFRTTIALFGASGQTGRQFLSKALAQGYRVRALVRTPAKLAAVRSPQLDIIAGDVLDADAVRRTVQGTDVVVSLFGQVKGLPPDVQTRGTQHIVAAMQQLGAQKIISLSGGGLP